MNNNPILVFVELTEENTILPISLEVLTMGRRLAEKLKGQLCGLIMGSGTANGAEELRHYGVDRVYVVDSPLLQSYQPECYLPAFEQVYKKTNPVVIIMGNSLLSLDFAPRIAFRLNAGLITDCVGIQNDGDELVFTKPVYSSNVMADFTFESEPFLVTMRSRAVEPAMRFEEARGEVTPVSIEIDTSTMKTEVIQRVHEQEEGVKLENAEVIVAGGRGIGGPEGVAQLSELAQVLGAALGASRPPCDLGWISPKKQIGQTGEIVGPSVYIAIGISGATQHLAGMLGSKVIVAINKDPQANIFNIANYGAVGDYREILPAFIDALKTE